MKKKSLILIIVVALVAILAVVVVSRRGSSSTFEQDFHVATPSTITKVFMADMNGHSVTLSRHSAVPADSSWLVDGTWPASLPMVERMKEIMGDMRIREQVNKAAIPGVLKAIAGKSTKIEVYQEVYFIDWFRGKLRLFPHEKKTRTYYLGSETKDLLGSYMVRDGDKVPYVIYIPHFRGFITSASFSTDPMLWRSHRIVDLPVQQIASVKLELPEASQENFEIVRAGESFEMRLLNPPTLVNGFDTARVAQMLSSFVNLNFDEYAKVVPKVELDTTFSRAPRTILTIEDVQGNVTELKTYIKYKNPDDIKAMPDTTMYEVFDLDRLYAVINNEDTVLIQYYTFDNILQPASFFLGQKKTKVARD